MATKSSEAESVGPMQYSRSKCAARDALFGMLGYSLPRRSGCVDEVALEQKRKQIEKSQKHLLHQEGEGREYDLSWWRTCRDFEWLKAEGAEGM